MKLLAAVVGALALATTLATVEQTVECVDFSLSAGTGCAWMCNYCATTLGTDNYYFTTDVCSYQEGVGCVGSPQAGITYRCCAAAAEEDEEVLLAEDSLEGTEEEECWEAFDELEDGDVPFELELELEDVYLLTINVKLAKLA